MSELVLPEYLNNIGEYMKTTGASGLLLHTSEDESPYSDYDFYIVFRKQRERIGFTQRGKEHVKNIGDMMPARVVLNWINPYGGLNSIFDVGGKVVKIDIGCETMKSVQRSSGILNSRIVFDETGKLEEYLGVKKEGVLKKNFHASPTELQSLLEQYYGYNWNALSKLWKGDYKLVAFEFIPTYLSIIARLEHACNGKINTNYYKSNENMRAETAARLDDIDIRPQLGALISTLEKLQTLFHDLGLEVSDKNHLVFPEEAERLFLQELRNLRG